MSNKKPAYYAIARGRKIGVVRTWAECQELTDGYKGARFRRYGSQDEAEAWIEYFNKGNHEARGKRKGHGDKPTSAKTPVAKEPSHKKYKVDAVKDNHKVIYAWTDGGSRGNGSNLCSAAWAFYAESPLGEILTDSQVVPGATNNQMELRALQECLTVLSSKRYQYHKIILTSDSQYLLNGVNKWMYGWDKAGWPDTVKNKEQWQDILLKVRTLRDIEFKWAKGHDVNQGNNIVDAMLNEQMDKWEAATRGMAKA